MLPNYQSKKDRLVNQSTQAFSRGRMAIGQGLWNQMGLYIEALLGSREQVLYHLCKGHDVASDCCEAQLLRHS